MSLMPRKPVPALSLETVGGKRVNLSDMKPEQFTMTVFYRGYHYPVCQKYLTELDGLIDERPDGTLYWGTVSTMPFARPHFPEILAAIDFAVKNNYPARGEA